MRVFIVLGVFALACLACAVYFFFPAPEETVNSTDSFKIIEIGGTELRVTVAETAADRSRGLSGHEPLAENEGMLFVFPDDGLHGFWMKDMRFSIDMVWLSSRGKVVHIVRNAAPETYPQVFSPREPARYVLEVPAGYSAAHGIEIGSELRVESAL